MVGYTCLSVPLSICKTACSWLLWPKKIQICWLSGSLLFPMSFSSVEFYPHLDLLWVNKYIENDKYPKLKWICSTSVVDENTRPKTGTNIKESNIATESTDKRGYLHNSSYFSTKKKKIGHGSSLESLKCFLNEYPCRPSYFTNGSHLYRFSIHFNPCPAQPRYTLPFQTV